jgi:hypothetical protein
MNKVRHMLEVLKARPRGQGQGQAEQHPEETVAERVVAMSLSGNSENWPGHYLSDIIPF